MTIEAGFTTKKESTSPMGKKEKKKNKKKN
jgi:hypothetical protein